jgi:FdrA protein
VLAPAGARAGEHRAAVVAYVLGTEGDPQGYARQRDVLRQAGCIVPETAARAALAAAAVALREPPLVRRLP